MDLATETFRLLRKCNNLGDIACIAVLKGISVNSLEKFVVRGSIM
jgi:hypothetical protein